MISTTTPTLRGAVCWAGQGGPGFLVDTIGTEQLIGTATAQPEQLPPRHIISRLRSVAGPEAFLQYGARHGDVSR